MAKIDEGGLDRWEEVINGTIFMVEPSDFETHQNLVHKIISALKEQLQNTDYKVYGSGVGLEVDAENNFVPDVFVAKESMIKEEGGVEGIPFLLVEVISQESQDRDRGYKKDIYEKLGVKEYWVASPYSNNVEIYHLENGSYKHVGKYTSSDKINTFGVPSCTVDFSSII